MTTDTGATDTPTKTQGSAKTATTIAILYSLFAGLSTLVNIATQMLCMKLYHDAFAIEISIFVGTLVAMPIRYVLDKRYIFSYQTKNIEHDGRLFVLYSLMAVFTTVIFWGTEFAFQVLFSTDFMRYLGGVLGLAVGYYIKYRLDKRFVFVTPPPQAAAS